MKKHLLRLLKEQTGQALPLALAMLALGSLVIHPLMNLTMDSLKTGKTEENRLYEHYAANAGISDGLWQLVAESAGLPAVGANWTYNIPDTNGRAVSVTISHSENTTWVIESIATSSDGHSTKLVSHLQEMIIPPNAISSPSITIKNGGIVNGDIQYDSSANGTLSNQGTINGDIIDAPVNWPTIEAVSAYYLAQVQSAPTHEGNLFLSLGSETLADPYSLGPIYINGNLKINSIVGGAVRFDGTVYVEGNVSVGPNIHVYFNNNTVFHDGQFSLGAGASIYENGCIVGRNLIFIQPGYCRDAYLVMWSVEQYINLKPTDDLTGAAFASDEVTLETPSAPFTWAVPPPGLPLPPIGIDEPEFRMVGLESYEQ